MAWVWVTVAVFLCVAASLGLGACDGGTSSETVGFEPTQVEVTVEASALAGRTGKQNTVSLFSADFQPHADSGFAKTMPLDSLGQFHFADLPPGQYQLWVQQPSSGKTALITELTLPAKTGTRRSATLRVTSTLSGALPNAEASEWGLVYVPGTPLFAWADSLRHYALPGLPDGKYRVVKTWKPSCLPERICGGNPNPADTLLVEIRSGEDAVW